MVETADPVSSKALVGTPSIVTLVSFDEPTSVDTLCDLALRLVIWYKIAKKSLRMVQSYTTLQICVT